MGFISKQLFEFKESFLDLIFPFGIYCNVCNKPIYNEPYAICEDCRSRMPWIQEKACIKCGKSLPSWYFPDKCSDCTQNTHEYTKGFSCVEYDDTVRQMVIDFKYHGKAYYAKSIAEIMYDKFQSMNLNIDYIIPVPLHSDREKERGFNQSFLLAKHLSNWTNIQVKKDILYRCRHTESQNKLPLKKRKKNLSGAFKVLENGYLLRKNILLIDDVYTTGNTVDACAKELIGQGAKNVYILTFAIGKNV